MSLGLNYYGDSRVSIAQLQKIVCIHSFPVHLYNPDHSPQHRHLRSFQISPEHWFLINSISSTLGLSDSYFYDSLWLCSAYFRNSIVIKFKIFNLICIVVCWLKLKIEIRMGEEWGVLLIHSSKKLSKFFHYRHTRPSSQWRASSVCLDFPITKGHW